MSLNLSVAEKKAFTSLFRPIFVSHKSAVLVYKVLGIFSHSFRCSNPPLVFDILWKS
jgi:hypothetical protein